MNQVVVSQQTGYARNASESAYPNLWRGLVGWWLPSVNPRGGNRLFDLSPFRNHGTLTNMTNDDWVVSGGAGALDFDGTDDYVDSKTTMQLTGSFTVSAWINFSRIQSSASIVDALVNVQSTTYANYWANLGTVDSRLEFSLFDGTNNPRSSVLFSTTNKWLHVTGVRNVSSDTVVLFVDGVQVASVTDTTTSVPPHSQVSIGGQVAPAGRYANALLDDIRIYNRALTVPEIRLLASKRGIGLQPRPKQYTFYQTVTGSKRRRILTGMT